MTASAKRPRLNFETPGTRFRYITYPNASWRSAR